MADAAAFERARRPKPSKLAANAELRGVVAAKLDDDWSPQQIARWVRRESRMRLTWDGSSQPLHNNVPPASFSTPTKPNAPLS